MCNEQGYAVTFSINIPDAAKERIIDAVILHANAELPKGTRFEVRGMPKNYPDKSNYGIGWYTSDKIKQAKQPEFRKKYSEAQENEELGCLVIASLIVGNH